MPYNVYMYVRNVHVHIKRYKATIGYNLSFILSLPFSLVTVSALYIVIFGVYSQNLLMAIELIVSQSQFFGVRIAVSFSISPENMLGKI